MLIRLLQYVIYKQNGISEKKIGYTIKLLNHLDLENKIDDINNDRHEIYDKI